jgi:hypothetical protein
MNEFQQKTPPEAHTRAQGRGWTPREPLGGEQPPRREPPPPPPPPRSAWDPLDPETGPPPRSGPIDLHALFMVIEGLRRAMPSSVQEQFTTLVREVLLTLRSLIDWYLDRLDGRRREPEVEDIPID